MTRSPSWATAILNTCTESWEHFGLFSFYLYFWRLVNVHRCGWKILTGTVKRKKNWFKGDTNYQRSPLSRYKFSHNLPPHPQGSWFPLVCLHITCFWFTPSPLWMWVRACVLDVCFSSGLEVNACMFGCIYLYECTFLSYSLGCETGRWAWPRPMVTCFNNVYSASRNLSHWSSWESWLNMQCILPRCSALLWERWDAAIPL